MLRALGRASHRHPLLIVLLWLAFMLAGFAFGGQVMSRFDGTGLNVPGSESTQAGNIVSADSRTGDAITAVVTADGSGPVTAPAVRSQVESAVTAVRALSGVASVTDPYPHRVSRDGQALTIDVTFTYNLSDAAESTALDASYDRLHQIGGAQVEVSGGPLLNQDMNHTAKKSVVLAEEISLPLVLIGMVFVFGGFVAALLPLTVALCSISGALLILFGFSEVTNLSTYALQITTMIGLGLAVDYSLLIITRFREERAATWDVRKAVERTLATAGRTVFFSGVTVTVSALGLTLFDDTFLRSIGLAAASVVAFDLIAALTLLPALLVLCGSRIKAGKPPKANGFFSRLAGFALRMRIGVVAAAVAVLAVIMVPLFGVTFSNGDARSLSKGSESYQAYAVAEAHFGTASTNPVEVVLNGTGPQYTAFANQIESLPGVTSHTVNPLVGPNGSTVGTEVDLTPQGSDDGPAAQAIVHQVRDRRGSLDVLVGGNAARVVDFTAMLRSSLPFAAGLVGLAIMVLLFAFTGSLLIPLKTIATTLLSIGASLGIVTLVYQDGHGAGLLGAEGVGALNVVTVPVVAAIAFGLAMDYEVFILGRIREEWRATGSVAGSVAAGLQRSGRIVTSAALLIAIVFVCFLTGDNAVIGQIGLGLTLAVLIDASIVRLLLVPATMALLGRAAWWAPGPLRRLYDRFGLRDEPQGEQPDEEPAAAESAALAT
ncbi:MAG TPA: MMPL family transporter [Actinocrinis sp.]|jgi:RND superfamily putative drug exporter